jgi:hypothetical protein
MTPTANRWAATALMAAMLLTTAAAASDIHPRLIRPPRDEWVVEITAIERSGPADRAGLEVRDRILEVDGVRVASLAHLRRLLESVGYSARLTVLSWRTGRETTAWVYPEDGRIGIDARMVPAYPPRKYRY